MGRRRTLCAALLCAASSFAISAGAAYAQDGTWASEEQVTVTARRREETLQDVPIAVTAISGDALLASGATDITAISESVPNVTFETSRGTNSTLTAFVRGVGQQDPVAGFEQGVGIYLDDVYLNRPQAAVLDIYDVERVEVLRGPQGTLYGRNTTGGAVKYVNSRLDPTDPRFNARLSIGDYDQLDLVLSGSAPLTDTFRVGGAVAGLTRSGYGTNEFTGEDNYDKDVFASRVSAEWEPSSQFLVRISGDYVRDDSSPRQGYRLLPFTSATLDLPVLDNEYNTTAGLSELGPIHRNSVEAVGGQVHVEWAPTPEWTFRSISAYRRDKTESPLDLDSSPTAILDAPVVYRNKQFSEELQAVYEGDRLQFVGGLYYLDANAFNAFDVVFGSATSFTLGDVDTSTWAAFGELTYALTDTLSLTVGGRYTEDERSVEVQKEIFVGVNSPYFGNTGATSLTAPVIVNGEEVVPTFRGVRQDDAFTPRVILSWEPTRDLNIYASYSQGFKGGGFDPRGSYDTAAVRDGFEPEFVDSYEIGLKATLLGGRAHISTDVFFADYTDVQVPGAIVVPGPPVSFVGSTTNAGAAEIPGVEFEGDMRFDEHWSGTLAFGYVDAKYTEFVVGNVDVSDQRDIQNTPDWTGATSLTWGTPLALFGDDGRVSVTGNASYRGFTQQFEYATPLLDQEAYWLYNASVNWKSDNGRWTLALNGRNLSDERYITSGYTFLGAGTADTLLAFYGAPRTVTASVGISF